MRALADNDVLTKGSCYGLLRLLIGTVPGDGKVGILGTAKFVVPKTIRGAALRGDKKAAHSLFLEFAAENEIVEPSADEQEMAAIFEATALGYGPPPEPRCRREPGTTCLGYLSLCAMAPYRGQACNSGHRGDT